MKIPGSKDTKGISLNTSQTAKNSTKLVRASTAVKLLSKEIFIHNIFALLRTSDINTENTLPQNEAPRKPGRPPPIMTTTTNLNGLQTGLINLVKIHEIESTP
jgi:hypothetical protein